MNGLNDWTITYDPPPIPLRTDRKAYYAAYYAKNAESARGKRAAHHAENPEKGRARASAWKKANPEKHRARYMAWKKANQERNRANARAWQKANPEKSRARKSAWQQSNPDRCNAGGAQRRAAKIQAIPFWANLDFIKLIYKSAKDSGMVVDHIVPLQHELVCGLHWEGNLQLLTAAQNARKFNHLIGVCA